MVINYLASRLFFQLATDFGKPGESLSEQMNLGLVNTSHAVILGGLALGIKFAKNIYLQQKENSLLARRKIITDLRIEKTRIYPRLLYQSLDNMRSGISSGSVNASAQLLKVSELLSYILYDNNEKWVPVEKEILMMQHMIDIGRAGRSKHLDIRVSISGDPGNKFIAPMTLFPLLENCFKLLEDRQQPGSSLNLDIIINNTGLQVQLTLPGVLLRGAGGWKQFFDTTRMRLDALYPGACRLQINQHQQDTVVSLFVNIRSGTSAVLFTEDIKGVYEIE